MSPDATWIGLLIKLTYKTKAADIARSYRDTIGASMTEFSNRGDARGMVGRRLIEQLDNEGNSLMRSTNFEEKLAETEWADLVAPDDDFQQQQGLHNSL